MERLLVFVIACVAQVGCQSPNYGFDPFSVGRQTRVPPPPTGVVGTDNGYRAPLPPRPPANAGASTWPRQSRPGEFDVQYGPERYWEAASTQETTASSRQPETVADRRAVNDRRSGELDYQSSTNTSRRATSTQPRNLVKNERLGWHDPAPAFYAGPSVPTYSEFASRSPVSGTYRGQSSPPRLLQNTPSATPIAAPRIRGFTGSYGQQPVRIPAQLADFRNDGIRQATATSSSWESRFDDVRR